MKYFLLVYDVVDRYVERRVPFREEHLALAQEYADRGQLMLGGALADPVDQAVLVFRAENEEVVKEFVERDPYVQNGLIVRHRIRPWSVVIGAQ